MFEATERGGVLLRVAVATAVGLALAVGAAYFLFGRPPEPALTYTVTFADVRGLRAGSPVTLEGDQIGHVTAIAQAADEEGRWRVELGIHPEHREAVRGGDGGSARLVRRGWVRRQTEVRIVNLPDAGEPVEEGALVRGLDSRAEEQAFRARDAAQRGWEGVRQGWEALSARLGATVDEARDWFTSPEAQELKGRIDQLRDDIAGFTTARTEEASVALQRMTARGRELAEELRELGRDDIAEELSESMDTLHEQYEEAMEGREEEEEEEEE